MTNNKSNNKSNESSEFKIKIIPLGGVEEIGMNCTAIEIEDQIFVVDVGLGFPEKDNIGIDYLVPNTKYLEKNKSKIKGIFITHAHLDHIGGLEVILPSLKFPEIYCPSFPAEIIKKRASEAKILDKINFNIYKERSVYNFGKIKITFFRVNHSTPDAFGIIIRTPIGSIIHTGDFKVDNSPVGEEKPINYNKIGKEGSNGVIALLSDSTNSFKPGLSKSESQITEILKDVVERADGRIIVSTFSQLLTRVSQLMTVAKEQGRKVAVSGRSLEASLNAAMNLGYVKVPKNIMMPLYKVTKLPKNKQMIFTTGHQAEEHAALTRMAEDRHRDIDIQKGDTVIVSASVIPGNNLAVQKMIDGLYQQGARVFHQGIMDLHTGGHGNQEDQKIMINLAKPKYFIPVHGYQSFLAEHGKTAENLGIDKKNIVIAKNGREIIISKRKITTGKDYNSTPVIVSGSQYGKIDFSVIEEREELAKSGLIDVFARIVVENGKIKVETIVKTVGFEKEKSDTKLVKSIKDIAKDHILKQVDKKAEREKIEDVVRNEVTKFIRKQVDSKPFILVHVGK